MFELPDTKSFMDNVHGYIRIPKVFVRHIIDTPDFQRLRNIDQTGMKILYPAAKHDRFSHSLGVFHLGTIAVDALLKNFQSNSHWKIRSDRTSDIFWAKNKVLFLIACLLHDIGHTPFSHSLEQFYRFNEAPNEKTEELMKLLEISTGNTEEEFFYKSNEHEKMSALLVLREESPWRRRIEKIFDYLEKTPYPKQNFESDGEYDNIQQSINRKNQSEFDDDLRFIARMILGVKYSHYSPEKQVRNCFIELLNGSFDVDKLDYTVRDTKMSGISNTTIDIERLLNALTIIPTTVYVNTEVDIPPTQSIIITQMIPSVDNTFYVKGSFDREIQLQNCTIVFPKNTQIIYFHPENKNTDKGISADSAKISNNSIVFYKHQLQRKGKKHATIPTTENEQLELKDTTMLEDWDDVKVEGELYNLSFDSTNADKELSITTTSVYRTKAPYSFNFSGSLKGHFERFEILCDKLYEEGKVPTENYYTGFSIGFKKQAINLISNVTDARNYLYLWIYSHHKVIYYANYLIIELARLSIPWQNAGKELGSTMIDMMLDSKKAFMLDEDFIHIHIRMAFLHPDFSMYNYLFNEFSSRKYRTSLYKSLAEFDLIFDKFDDIKKQEMRDHLERISVILTDGKKPQVLVDVHKVQRLIALLGYGEIRPEVLSEMEFKGKKLSELVYDMIWVTSNPSLKRPSPSSIYITFDNKEKPVTTMDRLSILKLENLKSEQKYYFYLYYREKEKKELEKHGISKDNDLKRIITRAFVDYMESILS